MLDEKDTRLHPDTPGGGRTPTGPETGPGERGPAHGLATNRGLADGKTQTPSWAERDGILYPPRLPMEQCSSEQTARYKQALVKRLLNKDGTEAPIP